MILTLSPLRTDETLEVVKFGDVLRVNGEDFDFSPIGEGDTLNADAISSIWFSDKVERVNGELVLTLILPNPWNYSPEQAFPVQLLDVPDGPVALPQPLPITEEMNEEHSALMALVEGNPDV